jgi:predicted glycogen debranching enzyme
MDTVDGLLYAGQGGLQLTWMDAKVGDWVVTPRIGKPIEVNALWYNALLSMVQFARHLGQSHAEYDPIIERVQESFARFWNSKTGYCFDVLDGPNGHDTALRPNQLFAVCLPAQPEAALLSAAEQRAIVDICGRELLISYGLRSLSPKHPQYQGQYQGDQRQRDGAYHQGTAWAWLLGPYALAHFKVYSDPVAARQLLTPMANHLYAHGVGNISEIFDGDAPMTPRGCPAQAWSVAEVLRAWETIAQMSPHPIG